MDLIAAARAQARGGAGGGTGSRSTWAVIPPDTIPGYEIVKEIHRGGQGVVYQAIQKATKRKVAIKVMREGPFAGPRDRARFEREVEILAQLNHPNIVSIIDSGQAGGPAGEAAGGAFFFAMDYISGHPLDQWMSLKQRSLEETLKLFARICDAVNSAHLKGVIHRDLKPGNIRVDGSDEPHILDFGLAKVATGEVSDGDGAGGVGPMRMMTMTGQFVGSLPWASPEQAEGHPDKVDVRTDVYSLGVILFQMLTGGKFPYEVIGAMRDVLDNILRAAPQRPSTIRRQINDEVETIVLKSLAKERERRYQNAGELARDVRNYLGGFPIEAKRDSAVYQLRVIARRNKGKVLALGTISALVVVFGASMAWLYGEASAQRVRAEVERTRAEASLASEKVERARADDNFNAVRGLARTFIVDFNEEIKDLRGATRARETLLKQARAYLDRLSPQAGDDPVLKRELADAAERVGDLQAGLYLPKLGEPGAAEVAYAQARSLREEVLRALPDEARSHADMGRSFARSASLLFQTLKFAEAMDQAEKASAAYDRAIALAGPGTAGADEALALKARAAHFTGEVLAQMAEDSANPVTASELMDRAMARYDVAMLYWRDRLRARPGDDEAARWIGVGTNSKAMALLRVSTPYREAAKKAAKDRPEEAARLNASALEQAAKARAMASGAVEEFERLSASHPENGQLRRDVFLAHHAVGIAHMTAAQIMESGDGARREHEAALAAYRRALEVTEALARADESNIEAQRDLAVCLNKAGNELRDLGRTDEATAVFARSLDVRRTLVRTDPLHQHRRDLAVGAYKLGQMAAKRAKDIGGAERERLTDEARGYLEEARSAYAGLRDEGVLKPDAREFGIIDTMMKELGSGASAPEGKGP